MRFSRVWGSDCRGARAYLGQTFDRPRRTPLWTRRGQRRRPETRPAAHPAPAPGRAARCSGWSQVCGGDHRQGPRGHWGSDSSFLSLPELSPALRGPQPGRHKFSVPSWGQEQSAVHCHRPWVRWLCTSVWGYRGQVTVPTIFGSVFMGVPGKDGAGRGDPGSCDPFVALHRSRDLVCEQVRRAFTLSTPLP